MGSSWPFMRAWIAKPDVVVDVLIDVDDPSVDSGAADADVLLVPFFLPSC